MASRAPISIGGIGKFRRLLTALVLVVLVLVVWGAWYVTNPARVGRLAEVLLTNVFGGPVTVSHARLSFSGTLLLSGVELRTSRGLPVFSADEIEARFDWVSLVAGRLSATQLVAVKPTLFLVEDPATGHWNYQQLRSEHAAEAGAGASVESHRVASPAVAPALPVVILRAACVQWCEVHDGRIEATGRAVVDGQLVPESDKPIYHFQVVRHGSGASLVTGRWDVVSNRFVAVMEQITLTDDLKVSLPRPVREWWDEHRLRGSLSRLQVGFDNSDGLVLDVNLNGVSFVREAAGEEVAFRNLRGAVRLGVTKPSLQIKRLTGRVMTFAFSAEADWQGLSAESAFDFSVRFRNAYLSRDYPRLFMASPASQDLLTRIAPWGHFNLDLSVKREAEGGPMLFDGDLVANRAHLRFCHFPFPLHDMTGRIHFDNHRVTFHRVTARSDEAVIILDGYVGTGGTAYGLDLTVSSDDVVFDERIAACLPAHYKAVWDQFSLRSRGGFVCRASRSVEPGSEPVLTVAVDLKDGAGYMNMFPYRVSGTTGRIVFAADETHVENLVARSGEDGSGVLTFHGVVKHPHGDVARLMPELKLTADVPIDGALLGLFASDDMEGVELAGRVGFAGTVRKAVDTSASVAAEIVGDLVLKEASLNVPAKQLVFKDLSGTAQVATTVVREVHLSATMPEGLRVVASGSADMAAGVGAFKIVAEGKELAIPEDAPLSLPEAVRGEWSAYKPSGMVDVAASAEIVFGGERNMGEASMSLKDWSLVIVPRPMSLQNAAWPERIGDIVGKISADPRQVVFEGICGSSGPIHFKLDGSYEVVSGHCVVSGTAVAAEPPVEWYAKLPASFADFLNVNEFGGQFELGVSRLERVVVGFPWEFEGAFQAASAVLEGLSLSAENLSAEVKGTYESTVGLNMTGRLDATEFVVSGKHVDALRAEILVSAAKKSLNLANLEGEVAGGNLHGDITVLFGADPEFQGKLTLNDAGLADLMLSRDASEEDRKKIGEGRVTATLALEQTFGDAAGRGAGRFGRGELVVRGGKIYNVPLAMGLMQIVTLRLPVSGAFDQASMAYYLRDNEVVFEKVLLESPGINLVGDGSMSLATVPPTLDLKFVTESPHELRIPLVTPLFRGTRNELLQIGVTGALDNPKITPRPFNPVFSIIQALVPRKRAAEE